MDYFNKLFSIKEDGVHKEICILGLKLKFKYPQKPIITLSEIHSINNYNDIKIAFYVGHKGQATRYRVYNIVEGLTKRGILADIYEGDCFETLNYRKYDLLIVFRAGASDSIYIEKLLETLDLYKKKNIPIVYDVDDLITNINAKYKNNIINIIKKCNILTCSTTPLGEAFSIPPPPEMHAL